MGDLHHQLEESKESVIYSSASMDDHAKPLDDAVNKDDLGNAIAPIPSNTLGSIAEFKTGGLSDVEQNLKVIEEAVEAIGFGKFHWQLTMSCGFGFLADQVCFFKSDIPASKP